jgi:hypothetical protein
VTEDRVHAYGLIVQGLRKDDGTLADEGLAQLARVDKKIHEHENAD